ncbi:hypothetical protein [Photobacterium minamisatsumaniensis]|uniref:hypothetical protein n=1 Tax=Photobacterium minamisatsumaniensis TaxID=2910233 RepID=UPI003D0AFFEA
MSENQSTSEQHSIDEQQCIGDTYLSGALAKDFEPIDDVNLLNKALGAPDEGGLCSGQVYISQEQADIVINRAWNSTNPASKLGQWWAFNTPKGSIAKYREDYEICYQWSPLDKMISCKLKPGTKVVVGAGQSAKCSEYLNYPVSAQQQIYIENAKSAVLECVEFDGQFSWQRSE